MKIFIGKVVSKKMAKTATVAVERVMVHPIYRKRVKRVKKYHVHDTLGAKLGQTVKFVASKPYSKTKKWRTMAILDNQGKKEQKKGVGTSKTKVRRFAKK